MSQGQQKVVLVTGCSKGGIGHSLCDAFAAKGCRVYASARRVEAMDGFKHAGIRRVTLDVTKDEDVKSAIDFVISEEGRIDILVNNAGTLCIGPIIDIPAEQAAQCFDTNFISVLRMTNEVVPHMASKKHGLIVNIGSVTGEIPTPFNGMYSAAKAALHSMTDTLSLELAPLGIRTLLISPASVKSNIAQNHSKIFTLPPNSLYKSYLDRIIGRMYMSQKEGTYVTADVFAAQVVERALRPTPPWFWRGGGGAFKWLFLNLIPRRWALGMLWNIIAGKK
ncbi:NAD(P)-binding protein [Sistotremastrum suecicum HHB10207 ss-3]|uniref:NAD(P)-binding protein n=1 Tax=Sistotremastrum suecicum HHB10207 ss-3 TaxID=1314776 RepID=A0A166G6X1_9AGAM|nr:NAD(P)-binding protein [Sistotremastrum suecicum HHB10207 ss-3]